MTTIASQITSLTIVYPTFYSGADQSKHQSSAALAFVCGIHHGPVNSPHKGPVTRKMLPFDDVIMRIFEGGGTLLCIVECQSLRYICRIASSYRIASSFKQPHSIDIWRNITHIFYSVSIEKSYAQLMMHIHSMAFFLVNSLSFCPI